MNLSLGPSLRLSLTCSVCEQAIEDENDLAEALLFGVVDPYALCPACKHKVDAQTKADQEYRRRVRVYLFEKYQRVVKE